MLKEAIDEIINGDSVRFFMPGHKGRLEKINPFYDVTEIDGTDDLRKPSSFLLSSQEKASRVYGAKHSFFLVNGSTTGLWASLKIFKDNYGKKLAVNDNCHVAIKNAAEILGIELAGWDIDNVDGVLVTSPHYNGVCEDLVAINKMCKDKNKLLIVDAAHGAHLAFSDELPICAVAAGADLVVMSTHKTLPALTQTAILHSNLELDRQIIQEAVNLFQTTSPSYLLLQSIEYAVDYMTQNGKECLNWLVGRCERIREIIPCMSHSFYDKTKLVFKSNIAKLRANNIFPEQECFSAFDKAFTEKDNVLLMTSVFNTDEDFDKLENYLAN